MSGRFTLDDYVPVNERIIAFYAKHPEGSLQSELVELSESRVVMRAFAYRTPADERPGIGYSSLDIPGRTPYTQGSEIENAETSAWGRAIAALGFEVKRGIASREEVANKRDEGETRDEPAGEIEDLMGMVSKTGTVKKGQGQANRLEARQGPDGYVIGFTLETDKGSIPQVIVSAEAGDALMLACGGKPETLKGHRITVRGFLYSVRQKGRPMYHRLKVTGWETADYRFPVEDEPKAEAPTAPLFDDAEQAALDAAVDAA